MMDSRLMDDAARLLQDLREKGLKLATVESCTGGLIAGALTEIAGSSDVLECGFVTYSNAAKAAMVDVPTATLKRFGAVSEPVAVAMAEGGLKRAGTEIAIAVTGIAGPGGGSAERPVGLVHFACAGRARPTLHQRHCIADRGRSFIRRQTVEQAFRLIRAQLDQFP